ncbi:serine protease inhibitor 42Dd-like [Drosophila santomea]|uniref:serine protease inhibitor 42Dd-like n=1 Tax=Drosophila santomea TaxID=129105 RepID=UPI001952B00D|nr:serine protease inhibitor 42Dd-like [Drosophila santomea]
MKYLYWILLTTSVLSQFTNKLYRNFLQDNNQHNIIFSPLCVEIGMSMILMGAEGNTANELRKVLNLPEDKKELANLYDELWTKLERRKKVAILHLANRLFVNETIGVNERFNKLVNKYFRAEAEAIKLADRSKAARAINDWVLDQTLDNVKDIVTPSDLTPDESAVMINAAFFKGYWKTRFEKKNTKPKIFYVSKNYTVIVNMMSQDGRFKMRTSPFDQIIELPFAYSNLSMVIVLPKDNGSLTRAEATIESYSQIVLTEMDVHVQLPKFKIDFRTQLVETLKSMGIKDLFNSSSDISSLLNQTGTRISQVVHKALIEIDEEGASAGSASASLFRGLSDYPGSVASFTVNSPFVFMIRDNDNIYFRGRVVDPSMKIIPFNRRII